MNHCDYRIMADSKDIQCLGCMKSLKQNTILKHLSHKFHCKEKYSETEIEDFIKASKESSKKKEQAWKKADYQKNKEHTSQKRSYAYKKSKLRRFANFLNVNCNGYVSRKEEIFNNFELSQEFKSELDLACDVLVNRFKELNKQIDQSLSDFDPSDVENKINRMSAEWNELVLQTENVFKRDELVANQMSEAQSKSEVKDDIDCKACHKTFRQNTILRHLVKHQICEGQYDQLELENLKANTILREKQRYEREKDNISQRKKEQRKSSREFERKYNINAQIKKFHKSKIDLDVSLKSSLTILPDLNWWKPCNLEMDTPNVCIYYVKPQIGIRGSRCLKLMQDYKKANAEAREVAAIIESAIHSKIYELENEIEEVKNEVTEVIGCYEFDIEGLWEQEFLNDRQFCWDMFLNLQSHVFAELESLYIFCLSTIYQNAKRAKDDFHWKLDLISGDQHFDGYERICESLGIFGANQAKCAEIMNSFPRSP